MPSRARVTIGCVGTGGSAEAGGVVKALDGVDVVGSGVASIAGDDEDGCCGDVDAPARGDVEAAPSVSGGVAAAARVGCEDIVGAARVGEDVVAVARGVEDGVAAVWRGDGVACGRGGEGGGAG